MRNAKKKEKKKKEKEKKRAKRGKERRRKKRAKTVTVKRRCEDFVSVEAIEIFSQRRDLETCGDLSWEDLVEELENCLTVILLLVSWCWRCLM